MFQLVLPFSAFFLEGKTGCDFEMRIFFLVHFIELVHYVDTHAKVI